MESLKDAKRAVAMAGRTVAASVAKWVVLKVVVMAAKWAVLKVDQLAVHWVLLWVASWGNGMAAQWGL